MTSCNGHFLSKSVADSGFIVADSELGDFAIENILSHQADLAWRGDLFHSVSGGANILQVNLKEFEVIDTLALCLHNFTSDAVITVKFYDSRLNSPLLTVVETVGGSDAIPAYKNLILSFQEISAKEIDIYIYDQGNPDGYLQVRRLKMGLMTTPETGFDFGYRFGFVSGEEYRAGEITWMWNTEAELNSMNELIRDYGVDPDKYARTRAGELLGFPDDILWLGYPESTNDTTKNQHIALVALVGADIPYRPNAAQGVFIARFEEVYYEPIVEAPTAFVTTWKTTGASESVTLPATGTNSFYVDWGDGDSELVTTASPSHVYLVAGEYVVSIEGICRKWYQNNTGDKTKIIELSQWGDVGFTELNSAFYGCTALDVTATDYPDTSLMADLSHQFHLCGASLQFNVERWNVSSCENFTSQFSDCGDTTEMPVSKWDVSSGIYFTGQFYKCTDVESFPVTDWNVANGEDFSHQFDYCLTAPLFPVGAWNVSSGQDFSYQFANCTLAVSYGVATWPLYSVTDMDFMFYSSGLTDTEYDEILPGWELYIPYSTNFTMHFGTAQYSTGAPADARAALVSDGITINDGGAV